MGLPVVHEGRMQIPDEQLAARCRAGDLEAFGQVYAQYERLVFRHAYYLLGHREDADDVKQETFLRAHRAMANFRNECSLATWLLKICGNLCRDRIKRRERHPEALYDSRQAEKYLDHGDHFIDPQVELDRSETMDTLMRALQGMPMPQRDLIVMHEIECLSCREIGAILGCSEASAKVRIFRARSRFKERVAALLEIKE